MKKSLCLLVGLVLISGIVVAQPSVSHDKPDNPVPPGTILGSFTEVISVDDTDPMNVVVRFRTVNNSTNTEWLEDTTVRFPAGMMINAATLVDPGDPDLTEVPAININGNEVTFIDSGAYCGGLGFLAASGGDFEFDVTVDPMGIGGLQLVTYILTGDIWLGGTESIVCSASDPCVYDACYGTQTPEIVADLEIEFPEGVPALPLPALALLMLALAAVTIVTLRLRAV